MAVVPERWLSVMARRGFAARFVATVSLVVGSSLVWTSGPAQAAEPIPVDSRVGVLDGLWGVVQDPATALDLIIGDLNRNGVPDPQETTDMPWMGAAIAKVGGTPTQVQAGEKLASRACKTGWGCLGVLGTMLGLYAAGETSDVWGPYIYTRFGEGSSLDDLDPNYYTSERPEKIVQGVATSVSPDSPNIVVTSTSRTFDACRYGCNIKNRIAVDFVHRTTGVWQHWSLDQTKGWTYSVADVGYNLMNLNTQGYSAATHEIRRVHFSEKIADNPTATVYGLDRGFYWGEELLPAGGQIEGLTRCKTPSGDVYDVIGLEPLSSGLSPIKACNPGDEAVYVETTTIAPNGTRSPQTSQRLSSPADAAEVFPECSPGGSVYGGCTWQVKVGGVPCVEGAPSCVNWVSDKNSATCFYGPYQLPLSQCYWLERAYEGGTEPIPGTVPNTDGDPATYDGPAPSWNPSTATPSPSSTPSTTTTPSPSPTPTSTGNPLPTPTPTPTPSPDPTPTPDPSPDPTPSTDPSPDPSPSPSPSASQPSPTPSPSPTPDTLARACTTTYNLGGGIQPEAVAVANEVGPMFGVDTIYGYAERGSEHSVGLALDFMVYEDSAKGQAITDYLQANHERLGVRWIIWEQHVWNVERASEGWRLMEDRGSPTQNHMDHPHVFLYDRDLPGVPADASCGGDPITGGADGECFPSGWSWNPIQWVLQPVKCAMTWAFVPDATAVQTDLDELRDAWNNHPPGSLVETVRPVLAGLGTGWDAGCVMPDFSPIDSETLRLPCEPPGGNVWTTLYVATQGFLVITTGIYLWGMLAAGLSARATGA